MNVFYCLIHLPGAATPELDVLDAETLSEALARLVRIPRDWPGLHGVELYCCNDLINRFQANDLLAAA